MSQAMPVFFLLVALLLCSGFSLSSAGSKGTSGGSSRDELAHAEILRNITQIFPQLLDVPYETVIKFMATEKAAKEAREDAEATAAATAAAQAAAAEAEAAEKEMAVTRLKKKLEQEKQEKLHQQQQSKQQEKEKSKQAAMAAAAAAHEAEGSFFVGLPEGSGQQTGKCDKVLTQQVDTAAGQELHWIQGRTSMTTGAMTLIYFMSQECTSCHEVAVKINSIYKKWRHRGLNVLAIHSSPKGYASSAEDIARLRQFLQEEGIEFAIVDVASKDGEQPVLRSGLPDWKRAARTPTKKSSLYRYLFDELEYAVPTAIIYKNCVPLMADPLDGYHIMSLDRSIASAQDSMLWPYGQLHDDETNQEAFAQAAVQHGAASPDELELDWDGEVLLPDADGEDWGDSVTASSSSSRSASQRGDGAGSTRRRGRKRKEKKEKTQTAATKSASADTSASARARAQQRRRAAAFDPRDDISAVIEGNEDEGEDEGEGEGKRKLEEENEDYDDYDSDSDNGRGKGRSSIHEAFDTAFGDGTVQQKPGSSQSGAARRKNRLAEQKQAEEEEDRPAPKRRRDEPGLKRRRSGV